MFKSKTLIDYLSLIITSIGTILGAVGLYLTINSTLLVNVVYFRVVIGLIILSGISLFAFLLKLRTSIRYKRYALAYITINKAFTHSHKLILHENILAQLPDALHHLELFCNELSATFSGITNKTCSVCIKLFTLTENNEIAVHTLCRDFDSNSSGARVHPDEDTDHLLKENTDFTWIFEHIDKTGIQFHYYFSNSLPLEDFYINSRINSDEYPPKSKIIIWKEILRCFRWPLPYRSTIVVPITPLTEQKINEGEIVGYLCIDSPSFWTFNKKFDIHIMRGVADGLYSSMKLISETHFKGVHKQVHKKKDHK